MGIASSKIEKAWALVNIVALLGLMGWTIAQDKATREALVSGLPALFFASFFFSIGGSFMYSGRIPLRYAGGYITRVDSPNSFWMIVTINFLVGLRLLFLW